MNRAEALKILELDAGATLEDAKRAYRKLAMRYHPDRNQGDKAAEEKFKQVKAAYEYLENPAPGPQAAGHGPGINDLFKEMMRRANGPTPFGSFAFNRIYVVTINLTLREAFEGCQRKVHVRDKELTVNVPPGICPDMVVAEAQLGEPGNQSIVHVGVNIDTDGAVVHWRNSQAVMLGFERAGDMVVPLRVSAARLMLGGFVTYQTLDGRELRVRVPEGMESGRKLKLAGHGYWRSPEASSRGDVYLQVIPYISKLDDLPPAEAAELFAKLKKRFDKEEKKE